MRLCVEKRRGTALLENTSILFMKIPPLGNPPGKKRKADCKPTLSTVPCKRQESHLPTSITFLPEIYSISASLPPLASEPFIPFLGQYGACSTMAQTLAMVRHPGGNWSRAALCGGYLLPLLLGGTSISFSSGIRRTAHSHRPMGQ